MAIGGSKIVCYIPAMAHEAGINIVLKNFDELSSKVPNISKINPSGPKTINDFHNAGGIQYIKITKKD